MSDFNSVYPETTVLNPGKRVNYIHGLVLGVDEFRQEELYLLEKDRLHNRSLHGYGTVCGLKIEKESSDAGLQINVGAGIGVSHSGQVVEVPRCQYAVLDEWIASHGDEIAVQLGSPSSGPLSLYLMLCYRECKSDLVPIPSGPCQSLEETTAASRIADDFSLSFELQEPAEEHFTSAMQGFANLLMSIPVEAGGAMTLDELKDLVRGLIPQGSPSVSVPDSPPASPALAGAIAPENVDEFYHAAFLVWVTEVKPCLITNSGECVPSDPYQNCVFLAEIQCAVETIDGVTRLDPNVAVEIDESRRQFLINSQGLQNYLTPLSYWLKSMGYMGSPEALGPGAGDTNVVTLGGTQTITGKKSFSQPITLLGQGRVLKNIVLPAHQAHHGRGAAKALFADTLPAMHFLTNGTNAFSGEALFNIPLPEDMVYNRGFQFRLVWGFQGAPEPSDISFRWRVGAQFYEANQAVGTSPLEFTEVQVDEASVRRNDVLVTPFQDFDSSITLTNDDIYGALQISIEDPGSAISQVYLLQVELQYAANRLGGRI
jgi:hypothetical protein